MAYTYFLLWFLWLASQQKPEANFASTCPPRCRCRKKKKEASRIASKCPKNLLKLAGPIGASQQVSEVSQQLKVAVTRTKDELAQLQNDVTQLRTRAAAPFQTNNQTRCK